MKYVLALGIVAVLTIGIAYGVTWDDEYHCSDCNVVIIAVDTLRADALHGFGYEKETTPTIDSLMARGISFTNAISASSWTVPSFMSIFTGLYPSEHRLTNKFAAFSTATATLSNLDALRPGTRTLAQVFKDAGYATGGFTGDAGVSAKFGYNKGFDAYTDETTFGGFENSEGHALAWLDSLPRGQKFFMFFHGYDLHGQFNLADPKNARFVPVYDGELVGTKDEEARLREAQLERDGLHMTDADAEFWRGIYDSKIADADARVAAFLDELSRRGLREKTIIIVLSDHGEEFYEHRGFDHGHALYDELVHVPLIISIPGRHEASTIDAQVSTMDVAPTILEIIGVQPDPVFAAQLMDRRSLVPIMSGDTGGYDVFTETDYRNARHQRSVRTADGWKYILSLDTHQEELYNLNADPYESENVAVAQPEKKDVLRRLLLAHMRDSLGQMLDDVVPTECLPVYDGECQ